jgi:HK97 family phage portal protein
MLGKFFKRFERKSTDTFDVLLGIGMQTAANIAVSPEVALRCIPVYAGVRVRCETLGTLPLHLYLRGDGGQKDRAIDHPLYKLLHDRPNAWTSAPEFVMQMEQDTITHGGGFALANRSGDKIVELIRLPPNAVTVRIDPITLEPSYDLVVAGGTKINYAWKDILHVPTDLPGLNWSSLASSTAGHGSPIRQAREAIGLTMAMERHAGALFGNGARPAGILKFKRKLTDDVHERLRKSWSSGHSGENAGKTAILEDDADFVPLTFNSVDMQFSEMRAFQVVEIARALGVPPTLMMELGRATWKNAEEMAQNFLAFTILPRMKLWQGAVARLLSADEQARYYAEFMVDELVKADIAQRFAAYAQAIQSRIINPNEARAKENMAPYAGGDEFANPNITPNAAAPPIEPPVRSKPRAVA